MIDLYFWPTPNGYKPLILLEELGLTYVVRPVNILQDEQFDPGFSAISLNSKVPAMVDHDRRGDGTPVQLFEGGAILSYLADKGDALHSSDLDDRFEVQQWLYWQVGGLGPIMGQAGHFYLFATEQVPYAKTRFLTETQRLIGVMERRLADRDYLAGRYSIADIACYPWVRLLSLIQLSLDPYPRVAAWKAAIGARPAVQRAYEIGPRYGNERVPIQSAATGASVASAA